MVGKLWNIVGSSLLFTYIYILYVSVILFLSTWVYSKTVQCTLDYETAVCCELGSCWVASTRVRMNTTESFSSMTKKDLEGRGHAYSDTIIVSFGEEYRNDTRFCIIPHDQWAFTLQKHNAAAAKWLESLEAVPWMHCGERRRGEDAKMRFVFCVLSPAGCNHVGLDLKLHSFLSYQIWFESHGTKYTKYKLDLFPGYNQLQLWPLQLQMRIKLPYLQCLRLGVAGLIYG